MAGTDYVVDPTNVNSPIDGNIARKGAAEFRSIKAYIASLFGLPSGLQLSGFKNRVINGDCRIDNANFGTVSTINAAILYYPIDCWLASGSAALGIFTVQQQSATPPAGYKNYLRATVTTIDAVPGAVSAYILYSRIEGLNIIDFQFGQAGAVQFTTSMMLRSSVTGQFSGSFLNAAGNRSYPWTCNIPVANVWTPVSVTITADTAGVWATDNTVGLQMAVDLGCGPVFRGPAAGAWAAANYYGVTGSVQLITTIGATLDITALQIEKGSSASPFEFRDYNSENLRCQRYLPCIMGLGVSAADFLHTPIFCSTASNVYAEWKLAVPPRVRPSGIAVSSPAHFSVQASAVAVCNSIVFQGSSMDSILMSVQQAAATWTPNSAGLFYCSTVGTVYLFATGARL